MWDSGVDQGTPVAQDSVDFPTANHFILLDLSVVQVHSFIDVRCFNGWSSAN